MVIVFFSHFFGDEREYVEKCVAAEAKKYISDFFRKTIKDNSEYLKDILKND